MRGVHLEVPLGRPTVGAAVNEVYFVVYLVGGQPRRVGPLPENSARPLALEMARRPDTQNVVLEEWACINKEAFSGSR